MRTKALRRTLSAALALFVAFSLLGGGNVAGADSVLTLGREERWEGMAVLDHVRQAPGRWGAMDLVLSDAAYESSASTELLLHFDELPPSDSAARYDVAGAGVELSTREKVMGAASAAFLPSSSPLLLQPRRGSMLQPGSMWQDFSIEFWLYPAALSDGERIMGWSAQSMKGSELHEQAFDVTFRRRRLVFGFTGLFGEAGGGRIELAGITALLPRQWHHHLLRFDSRQGMLEYLVDGIPEAVAFATDTGRDGGSVTLPVIGPGSASPLWLGGGVSALLDELRWSRGFVTDPQLTRLDGRTGTAVSRIFDLGLQGTRLDSIDAVYGTPGNTDVYFYYRMSDRIRARGELDSSWAQFAPGSGELPGRGRYLQLMVELLPDGMLGESPSVSSVSVRYEPDLPPAPPARVLASPLDSAVSLSWSRVNESDVAGYRVYYGTRPGVYTSVVDVGMRTEYRVEGLENGRLYYFTVVTYDSADTSRRSAFAAEAASRPSGLGRGSAP